MRKPASVSQSTFHPQTNTNSGQSSPYKNRNSKQTSLQRITSRHFSLETSVDDTSRQVAQLEKRVHVLTQIEEQRKKQESIRQRQLSKQHETQERARKESERSNQEIVRRRSVILYERYAKA